MATTYTTFAKAQSDALTDYSEAPNLRQNGGTVHHLDVTVTLIPVQNDSLYLARLPKGARLLPQLCSVDFGDPTSATTGTPVLAKIGHLYDDGTSALDMYAKALSFGYDAGRKAFSETTTVDNKGAAFLTPVTLTDDAWIVLTWDTATSALSHKETWHLAYTLA